MRESIGIKIYTIVLFLSLTVQLAASTVTDSILLNIEGKQIKEGTIHARCEGKHWSLLWDYVDGHNYTEVEVKMMSSDFEDPNYSYQSEISVHKCRDGRKELLKKEMIPHQYKASSVLLKRDGNMLHIYAGDGEEIITDGNLAFQVQKDNQVILRLHKPARVDMATAWVTYMEGGESGIGPLQLEERLHNSKDKLEGYWEFMDRDMPGNSVRLGGFYKLGIVRNDEYYKILYLDGVELYPELWQPLYLKGILRETSFQNHYDLEWIDAGRGLFMKGEMWASLESEGSVLSLHFPLLKTVIRFRRLQK